MKAAEMPVDPLRARGVDDVFGLPSDGINGLMDALRVRQDQVRFLQVRHKESAAFMACGYAKMDGQPVLAITGHRQHDVLNTFAQQDVGLTRAFEEVSVYNARVMGAAHVEELNNLDCRAALRHRGVAHPNFPIDLQREQLRDDTRSKRNVAGHTAPGRATERPGLGLALKEQEAERFAVFP
jgi:pyruvate dehydrogenase (quinone)